MSHPRRLPRVEITRRSLIRRRRRWLMLMAAAAVPSISMAQTSQWVGGSSDWNTATNWSPVGVPGSGVTTNVTSTLGLSQTISYDYTGSAVTLAGLRVDLTGGTAGAAETISMPANSLSAEIEYIGINGAAEFNQTGGTNTVGGTALGLVLGYNAATGTYVLSGAGALLSANVEDIGFSGQGNFYQSGGTNEINDGLYFGAADGSGMYSLSGNGILSVSGASYIGSGIFNQSGGSNSCANLGISANYTLGGTGALSVTTGESIFAGGSFYQSGGVNNSADIEVDGTYLLSGAGAILAGDEEIETGTFVQSGGTNTANSLILAHSPGASSTYILQGGTLTAAAVSINSGGVLNQSGGTIQGSVITTYTGGTFIESGQGAINGGMYVQSAGLTQVNGNVSVSGAPVLIKGGVLSGTGFLVGTVTLYPGAEIEPGALPADGNFGTLTIGSLDVAGGDARMDIGAGNSDTIAVTGTATFNGTWSITPVFDGLPTAGTYTLLTASTLNLDDAPTLNLLATSGSRGTIGLVETSTAIQLIVTANAANLTWIGSNNAGAWDLHSTQNWWNQNLGSTETANDYFYNLDAVTFDDTASNFNINLTSQATPYSVTFNNSLNNYVVTGTGGIAGVEGLTKLGSGTLILATANSYTGTTTISSGAIQLGNGGSVGSIVGNTIVDNGALILDRADSALVLSATISGSGSLKQIGTGTVEISGTNSFSGGTTIQNGVLLMANPSAFGSGPVTISNGGTLDLSALPAITDFSFESQLISISGTGVATAQFPDGEGAIFNSGDRQYLDGPFKNVVLTGNTTIGGYGGADAGPTGGFVGRYDFRSDVTGTLASLNLNGYTLTKIGNNQVSIVNDDVSDGNIVVDGGVLGFELNTVIANDDDGSDITFNDGTTLELYAEGTALEVTRPIVMNGPSAGVTIANYHTVPITLGSNITLSGTLIFTNQNSGIGATSGETQIAGNIGQPSGTVGQVVLTTSSEQPPPFVIFTGTNSYTGGTFISSPGAVLVAASAGALPPNGSVVNQGTLAIQAGTSTTPVISGNISGTGDLVVGTTSTPGYLRFSIDSGVSTQSALTVNSGSTLDLENGGLLVNYAGHPDPISAIRSYLNSGYENGNWNGTGISSSAIAGLNSSGSLVYSIGYADGADRLIGLSSGQIEVLVTLAGDAKLEGNVVFGDFQLLAEYFGSPGGWDEGNFTYGPTIDFADFQLLAQDFGANSSALTSGEIATLNSFAAGFGDSLIPNPDGVGFQTVSVPEPVGLLLLIASAGFMTRRRRGNNR